MPIGRGTGDPTVVEALEERCVLQVLANLDVVRTGDELSPEDALLLDTFAERAKMLDVRPTAEGSKR